MLLGIQICIEVMSFLEFFVDSINDWFVHIMVPQFHFISIYSMVFLLLLEFLRTHLNSFGY